MKFARVLLITVGFTAFLFGEVFAQRGGRRGFGSPDAFFDRLDQNGDGTIQPDEVPERMRSFLERAGVDTDQDLTRESFSQSMQRAREQFTGRRGARRTREGSAPSDSTQPVRPGMVTPNRVGEGRSSNQQRSPRFGRRGFFGRFGRNNDSEDSTSRDRRRGRSGDRETNESGRDRSQQFTQRLLDRYDRNQDGVLASDEVPDWLSRNATQLDSNGDGFLDAEELGNRFRQRWGRRSSEASEKASQNGAATAPSGLPPGLPAWFQETDKDQDLQIGFYEWERSRSEEFLTIDANNDGFLTPEEVLLANRPRAGSRRGSRRSFASEGRRRGRQGRR